MTSRASVSGDGDNFIVKVPVDNVELTLTVSPADAVRIASWTPSIARLNLGAEAGGAIQYALSRVLEDLNG